jgi:hypothetical protein
LEDRRCFYRARLLPRQLAVRAWKIAPGTPLAHSPKPSQAFQIIVENIGVGGLGIILPDKAVQESLTPTDRLRIKVVYEQITVLAEGRLRTPDAVQTSSELRTGIRFDGNPSNIGFHKARFSLSTIMGLVQREEIKARQTVDQPPDDIDVE